VTTKYTNNVGDSATGLPPPTNKFGTVRNEKKSLQIKYEIFLFERNTVHHYDWHATNTLDITIIISSSILNIVLSEIRNR
jgi:hypothetical protein